MGTAEFFGKYLNKGTKILVEGRIQNNNYTDDNGVNHYAQDIIVENVEFFIEPVDNDDLHFWEELLWKKFTELVRATSKKFHQLRNNNLYASRRADYF